MLATPGQLLVNEALPPELRDYTRTLGQDEINALLGQLAREYPERYREVCWKLTQLGRNAAFDEGSTITLNDLVPVVDKKPLLDEVKRQEQAILSDKSLTQSQKDDAIEALYGEATKRLTDETYSNALANNNPFAIQAKYKARGNKNQLGAMLTSPGTYTDSDGKIVPIFIGSAYAEGLKPHEYWAAGYGARLGVIGTKLGTQKGGYLSKMMNAAAIDQVVTTDDCGTSNGVPVPVDDNDNIGSVLQVEAAGFKPGTVITKPVLDKIRASGEDEIVIRSPMTCGCKDGLCKMCVGIRETGRFPEIGYNAGVNAASALGEQIAQNSLNCLAEGTMVRMADGSVRPIELVVPGDMVLGSDMHGRLSPTRVVARYDNGVQPCVDTKFVVNGTRRGGEGVHLVSTTAHPVLGTCFVSRQREAALNSMPRMLEVGTVSKHFYAYVPSSFVSQYSGPHRRNLVAFSRVSQVPVGNRHVYDLEVACPDHIYLLANGLIVHNTKHSGKRSDLGSYVGFDALKDLTMVPKAYDVKASVSAVDGTVSAIEDAPQGGQYVVLDDDRDGKIYVPPSLKVSVKPGDRIEAGDAVSSGLVSPADVVAYKGVGEGRRYFTNRFTQAFRDSHYGVNRRNVEILSRALVNNVMVENPDSEGDALPGDVVRYSAWASGYTPRAGAAQVPVDKAVGQYLEAPALHYTIGTRVTPSVVKMLKRHGCSDVTVNKTAPGVSPHMVSVVDAPAYSGDWVARLGTSYLKDRLLEDAQHGAHSELHSTNPIPSLAKGVELGRDIATTGEY